jgi:hypothetical protein
VVQPFDQDRWMEREKASGRDALDAFLGLSRMNLALFSFAFQRRAGNAAFPSRAGPDHGELDHALSWPSMMIRSSERPLTANGQQPAYRITPTALDTYLRRMVTLGVTVYSTSSKSTANLTQSSSGSRLLRIIPPVSGNGRHDLDPSSRDARDAC